MVKGFEAKLIAVSSAETVKNAKALLKSRCLLCAYRGEDGSMNAVFNQKQHYESVSVSAGEQNRSDCSCPENTGRLCQHAVAAIMYFARFKTSPLPPLKEENAGYAGLKSQDFAELAATGNYPPQARITVNIESELPHVPSKWENAVLTVKLKTDKKEYIGNINNLRQLYFDKSLAVSLKLSDFSLQDQQIIRFLAVNAEGEGSSLLLNSEQTAEFFHCLIGFKEFYRQNRRLIIHPEPAEPVLLKRALPDKTWYFPGIRINGALLPMKKARVITGRAGCWIGTSGEYWWMPATVDIAWLRNFFRLNEQEAEFRNTRQLLTENRFPLRILDAAGSAIASRTAKILLDARITGEQILQLEIKYLYDRRTVNADHGRLASDDGRFWVRDENLEKTVDEELTALGFTGRGNIKQLADPESIGVFLGEVLPWWLKQRNVLVSGNLAQLCCGGVNGAGVELKCSVLRKIENRFVIAYRLEGNGRTLNWNLLLKVLKSGRRYYLTGTEGVIFLNRPLRNFLLAADNLAQKLNQQEGTFELSRYSVNFWKYIARHFPAAIPAEFAASLPDIAAVHPEDSDFARRFTGTLREYQLEGVKWMREFTENGFNVILADEMGLGKTVQTLALLAARKRPADPTALIICPASLLENWRRECEKFIPAFRVIALSGAKRGVFWKNAADYDLMICSYAVARRDAQEIKSIEISYLILDEAQHIKNPDTVNARSCKNIKAEHRLVLTGTPLENSPDDLWSIFDFLQPGMLGSFSSFKKYYHEIGALKDLQHDLSERVAPFIKRRTKKAVCRELPPKIEQTLYCEMSPEQRHLYDSILNETRKQLRKLQQSGKTKANFEVLTTLMRLRQVCCHPALLPDGRGRGLEACKLELLKELVLENIDSNQKMLIFSQFTSLLHLIRAWLDRENIAYEYLDGATKKRQDRVDNFNNRNDIPVFLLSLKAGGTGLNLTSASTVIIYDPWWNPAVESQAADRTHRIGQTRTVNTLKLVAKDSIEEKILSLQAEKQQIFDHLIENPAAGVNKLTIRELKALL
ncbi:MAG: DEAD/DEAH box helicase [Victivallaceae bacterium]|nr:DEAD/DEAH box helicase [Victivallaceae bacterium]